MTVRTRLEALERQLSSVIALDSPSGDIARFLARSAPHALRRNVSMSEEDFAELVGAIREFVPGYGLEAAL